MSGLISIEEIHEIQENWGTQIVKIGQLFIQKEDYTSVAEKLVRDFYGYNETMTMFKPTRACKRQFRLTERGAVSYYIGNDQEYDEDKGFALQPWTNVRFENNGFIFEQDHAITMGNYYFTDLEGKEKKVEFTIGFFRSETGRIKINLHHSSIPYDATPQKA